MKTQNKNNETANTTITVEAFLQDSIKKNPTTGEINLADIEKATGLVRGEVVKSLRAYKGVGKYVIGRRSHPSRFIWGEKEKEAPVHNSPATPRAVRSSGNAMGYNLRLQIGDFQTQLPIKLELVR